jgi:hypothetical protein
LTATRDLRDTVDVEQALSQLEAETATLSVPEQARLLRLPVISAIRSAQPDGEARHRAMREALAGSGPSDEPWTRSALEVFESWDRALPPDLARTVDLPTARCFTGGCEVLVTFSDRASAERAAEAFRGIRETTGGHGGRVQTPPLSLDDDRVQVSWMLLRPDVPLP